MLFEASAFCASASLLPRAIRSYVCHELRNPLHILKACTTSMLQEVEGVEAEGAIVVPATAVLPASATTSQTGRVSERDTALVRHWGLCWSR